MSIFFPNLTIIRGFELFDQYSLVIFENLHLRELGLANLLKITNGSIRIANNPSLCYVLTVNWIEILTNMNSQQYIIKRNKDHCPLCKMISKGNGITNEFNQNYCWSYEDYQRSKS